MRPFADQEIQLLEDARGLVIDDCAVGALRLVEVLEGLPERRRAERLVDGVCRRLVSLIEGLPRIRAGLELG